LLRSSSEAQQGNETNLISISLKESWVRLGSLFLGVVTSVVFEYKNYCRLQLAFVNRVVPANEFALNYSFKLVKMSEEVQMWGIGQEYEFVNKKMEIREIV
jgi:hypothetical protein